MSQAPAMPVFTDALIGDTTHLSAEEFGAYCLILFATWRNNGVAFKDDDARLCRIARVTPQRWGRIRKTLVEFFDLSAGTWDQKRLRYEWNRVQISIIDKREKGIMGARARWLKDNNSGMAGANGSGNAKANSQGNGSGYGNHIHNHSITPKSPQAGTSGDKRSPRQKGTNPRALGTNPRAHIDSQFAYLHDWTPHQLRKRFNETEVHDPEHEAIRAIIAPNTSPHIF